MTRVEGGDKKLPTIDTSKLKTGAALTEEQAVTFLDNMMSDVQFFRPIYKERPKWTRWMGPRVFDLAMRCRCFRRAMWRHRFNQAVVKIARPPCPDNIGIGRKA